jgi:hypothetical protein
MQMKPDWKLVSSGLKGALFGLILIVPVVVYIQKFGDNITSNHSRWAEMGSAMSGIYGPILAVLTFAVLVHQIRLQKQTNQHMYDQAFLQNARADMEFYLMQLVNLLEKPTPQGPITRDVLHGVFEHVSVEELKGEQLKYYATSFHRDVPQLSAIWGAIYTVFGSLATSDEPHFKSHYSSAKLKAVAMLSYGTCVALDNYDSVQASDSVYPYQFGGPERMQ